MRVCLRVWMYTSPYTLTHTQTHTYTHTYTHAFTCVYMYISICMRICISIGMYIYTYTYNTNQRKQIQQRKYNKTKENLKPILVEHKTNTTKPKKAQENKTKLHHLPFSYYKLKLRKSPPGRSGSSR